MHDPPAKQITEPLDLLGRTLTELETFIASIGAPRYRASQLFDWMYGKRVQDFSQMSDVGKSLQQELSKHATISRLAIQKVQQSPIDGTIKFLFTLRDGLVIESVLIPSELADAPKRLTLCVSTQVGCPLDCAFCATASMKVKRNLSVGEIIAQVFGAMEYSGKNITNIVFMGMGEPMLNTENVIKSIAILTHERTALLGAKRITVSTAGIPEGIRMLATSSVKVKLAISLHATTDELRSRLMPINKRYKLSEVLAAAEEYYKARKERITYEYILFENVNDSLQDAQRLAAIVRRFPSKVNVIPFHSIDFVSPQGFASELRATSPAQFEKFIKRLRELDVTVMTRSSSGEDIDAACGQLAVKIENG